MKDYTVIMWLLLSKFRLFIRRPFGIRVVFCVLQYTFFVFFLSQMMNKSKEKSSISLLLIKTIQLHGTMTLQINLHSANALWNAILRLLFCNSFSVLYDFGLSCINNPTKKKQNISDVLLKKRKIR